MRFVRRCVLVVALIAGVVVLLRRLFGCVGAECRLYCCWRRRWRVRLRWLLEYALRMGSLDCSGSGSGSGGGGGGGASGQTNHAGWRGNRLRGARCGVTQISDAQAIELSVDDKRVGDKWHNRVGITRHCLSGHGVGHALGGGGNRCFSLMRLVVSRSFGCVLIGWCVIRYIHAREFFYDDRLVCEWIDESLLSLAAIGVARWRWSIRCCEWQRDRREWRRGDVRRIKKIGRARCRMRRGDTRSMGIRSHGRARTL